MVSCATTKACLAGVAVAPLVDPDHAVPSGPQVTVAWVMFGMATPSKPAVPNAWARRPAVDALKIDLVLAGARKEIAAIDAWKFSLVNFFTTKAEDTSARPWVVA